MAGACGVNRIRVGTISRVNFNVSGNRFIMVMNPDKTKGAAVLGVLNKVSATASNAVCISGMSVAGFGRGRLAGCHHSSINFMFRFCGLINGLATVRGMRLTLRVSGGPLDTGSILGSIKLNGELSGFPTRLSNNRRREISVTQTLTGGPGLLLYSRPANTLSCVANGSVLGLLRSAYHRGKIAIVMVARGSTLTPVTSGMVGIGGNEISGLLLGRRPAPIRCVR